MEKYGIATVIGIILMLPLLYMLHPLNAGAVGILSILCIGGANGAAAIINKKEKPGE